MSIDPNDPRLTAYVLGELDEAERAEIEAQLDHSESSRQLVEEVRATVELLTEELQKEPSPGLSPQHRKSIEAKLKQIESSRVKTLSKPVRKRWNFYRLSFGLAASVLIVCGITFALMFPRFTQQPATNLKYQPMIARNEGQLGDKVKVMLGKEFVSSGELISNKLMKAISTS